VLLLPELVGPRIERKSFRVAHAIRPDFRQLVLSADERIVGRRFAVRRDADDLADAIRQILRFFRLEVITERDEQIAVTRLHDTAADVGRAAGRSLLHINRLHALELRLVAQIDLRVRDDDLRAAADRFCVAEEDASALREIVREHHVHHPGLSAMIDLRHARERLGCLAVLRHEAHAAGPLGHQHAPVRQKGERPRMHQMLDNGGHSDLAGGGVEHFVGRVRRSGDNKSGRDEERGHAWRDLPDERTVRPMRCSVNRAPCRR